MQTPEDHDLSSSSERFDSDDARPAFREGLPPSFRMRADRHYVEELDSPVASSGIQRLATTSVDVDATEMDAVPVLVESIRRHGVLQPLLVQRVNGKLRLIDGRKRLKSAMAAGLRDVPCVIHDVSNSESAQLATEANVLRSTTDAATSVAPDPGRAADIHDEIAHALTDIESSASLLASTTLTLRQGVGLDLIRAHAWRMATLLGASRVIQWGIRGGQVASSARNVAVTVFEEAEAERRLRGSVIHLENEIPESVSIAGDPELLATALSGMLLATAAVADARRDVRISMRVALDPSGHVAFMVSETGVAVSSSWEARAFDPDWTERPGGVSATVCMLAARKIAAAYGGQVTVATLSRGAASKLIMPLAAA